MGKRLEPAGATVEDVEKERDSYPLVTRRPVIRGRSQFDNLITALGFHASRLLGTAEHVVDERTVDVGATEADGIEENIVIRDKVSGIG